MFIEDTTPIAALTVAYLKKLLKDSLREQKIDAIPPVTTPGKRYVYGLRGIQYVVSENRLNHDFIANIDVA